MLCNAPRRRGLIVCVRIHTYAHGQLLGFVSAMTVVFVCGWLAPYIRSEELAIYLVFAVSSFLYSVLDTLSLQQSGEPKYILP